MAAGPELILRARDGDLAAMEALILEYQQPMGRFVIAESGSRDDYLDLCQTVFVKMMRGLPRLRSAEVFEPWLYQIARNVCVDHLRKEGRRRKLFVPLTEQHDTAAPHAEPHHGNSADRLQAAMSQLGEGQREVLALAIESPRSYDELARLTSSTVPSVRSRLARARERLRQLLHRSGTKHGN